MGVITIGAKEFIRGVSTANDLPDGGFSPDDKGQNLLSNPGTMNQGTDLTQLNTNIVHEIFAAADDEQSAIGGLNLLYMVGRGVGGSDEAEFYQWDAIGNQPTLVQTDDSSAARTYSNSITQMEYYNNEIFATSSNNIAKLTASMAAIDPDWWSTVATANTLNTGVAHPLLKFDKKLWVGNKHQLDYWDGSAGVEAALDLTAKESGVIMALALDPGTGKMLIATSPNTSDATNHVGKIYTWDGFSPVPNSVARFNGYITAMYTFGGVVYVFYDDMIGFWNGSGVTPIRKLKIDRSTDDYIFRSRVTSIGDTLLITEQNAILAYGSIISGGRKVWYYPHTATKNLGLLHGISVNKVAVADINATSTLFGHIDMSVSTPNLSTVFKTNNYFLPSNSRIKKIEILTNALASSGSVVVKLRKSGSPTTDTTVGTFDTQGDSQVTFSNLKIDTASVQLRITFAGQNDVINIKQIKIHYDALEKQV